MRAGEDLSCKRASNDQCTAITDQYGQRQATDRGGNSSFSSKQVMSPTDVNLVAMKNDKMADIKYQYLTWDTKYATEPVFACTTNASTTTTGKQDIDRLKRPDLSAYENPFEWPIWRKRWMTWLACSVNAIAAYASGAYASPAAQLEREWQISYVAYNVGITIFTCGFAVAPMVLAPFSEINGRRPVFIATGILFVICQMWCALANNYPSMLLARFFLGVGGSTFSTMVGGILADVWITEERNTPMVLFTGATLFGTGLGPLVSGFVAQRLLWRWVFYIQIVTSGVLVSLVTIFFSETRGPVLLSRKAEKLNCWYEELEAAGAVGMILLAADDSIGSSNITAEHDLSTNSSPPSGLTDLTDSTGPTDSSYASNSPHSSSNEKIQCENTTSSYDTQPPINVSRIRYKVQGEEERSNIFQMIRLSLYRPITMLCTEPVIFFLSLWISFAWGILYLQFGSVPLVFETNHDFSLEQTGMVFISMCVGAILMTILGIYQEPWLLRKQAEGKFIINTDVVVGYFRRRGGKIRKEGKNGDGMDTDGGRVDIDNPTSTTASLPTTTSATTTTTKKMNQKSPPETRLYFTCIQSISLPLGIFWFGWTSTPTIHWIIPTISINFITMGIFSIFLAIFNYSADVYNSYASSAIAASSLCRNLLGGSFPLVTRQMFGGMGFQAASSLLGGIALVLSLVPWVLVLAGPEIRRRSRIARQFC